MTFPSQDKPAVSKWDVFISAKNEDFAAAEKIYRFLQSKGIRAFFSPESLPQMGQADYREQIDNAIETARHMVVVGSSRQNLESLWVKAEWSMFINEKRSGRKTGNLVTVVDSGLRVDNMPITLRQYEVLELEEEEALDRLLHYVGGIKPEGYPEITDDQAGTKPKPPAKAVIVGILRKPDTTKKKKGQKRILLLLAGLLGVLGLVIGLVLGIDGLEKFGLAPTATFFLRL